MTALSHLALPADARLSRWRAPDGWDHRRFDWPQPDRAARGRLLFQGGRSDVVEKYLEVVIHLHARGWAITSFDWRGQGGSGRLGPDPQVGHADNFGVHVRDLAAFWQEWRGDDAGPHVVVAHSMGGHFLLRALAERLIRPDAAVLSAPMVQIRSPIGAWLGARLARAMAGRGDPMRAAWRWSDDPRALERRRRRLTRDATRGQDGRWWHEADPSLMLGPPSWAWIVEAFRSGAALRHDPRLAAIDVPCQFLIAERDRLVDPRAARAVAARMPGAEVVRFGAESAHEILREGAAIRDRAYAAIDDFLDRRAPRR